MADNKETLMSNISKNVEEIKKSKFGTKLPSNPNKDIKNTIQELAYDQMIMGTLASLVWGKTNIKKEDQVKSLLGNNKNIYTFIENLKTNSENLYNLLNNVINTGKCVVHVKINKSSINDLSNTFCDAINQLNDSKNTNVSTNLLEIKISNADELTKFIEELNKFDNEKIKNTIGCIGSFVQALDSISQISGDKFNTSIKSLSQALNGKESSLHELFEKIGKSVSDLNISNNIVGLSNIIDSIIKVVSIDDKQINKRGLRKLLKLVDKDHGEIKELLENLNEITSKYTKISYDSVSTLNTLFEGITVLGDIGFIKRQRIKSNISYIKKFIKKNLPILFEDIKELSAKETNKDQKDNVYASINMLSSIFSLLSNVSELDFKKKLRLKLNLWYIKNFVIDEIIDIFRRVTDVTYKDGVIAAEAIESLSKILESFISLGDKSFFKIFKMSLKMKIITNTISDSIADLLNSIISISAEEQVENKLDSIEGVISSIIGIYDNTPSIMSSIKESERLSFLTDNIALYDKLIKEHINKLDDIYTENVFVKLNKILKIISAIYNNTPEKELSIKEGENFNAINDNIFLLRTLIHNTNLLNHINTLDVIQQDLLQLFNDILKLNTDDSGKIININRLEDLIDYLSKTADIIKNISVIIDNINNTPQIKRIGWINSLKKIFKEFDNSVNDSLGTLITYYMPSKELIDEFANIILSVKSYAEIINAIEDIKEQEEIINTLLGVTKTIAEQFNEDIKDSIASNFANIDKSDVEKISNIIDILKKVSELNKIKIILNISESSLNAIAKLGIPLRKFIEELKEISDDDIKHGKETIKLILGTVISAIGILVIASIAMSYIDPINLLLFTVTLSGFLFAIGLTFRMFNKAFKDEMKGVKDALILIGGAAAILLLGAYINNYVDYKSALLFTIKLGGFLFAIGLIFRMFHKGFENIMSGVENALLLVTGSSVILLMGSLFGKIIDFESVLLFTAELSIFLGAIGLVFLGVHKGFENYMNGARDAMHIVAISALILIIGSLACNYYKFEDVLLFTVELSIFIVALSGVLKLSSKILGKDSINNVKGITDIIIASSLIMIAAQLLYDFIDFDKVMGFALILGAFIVTLSGIFWLSSKWIKNAIKTVKSFIILVGLSALIMLIGAYFMSTDLMYKSFEFAAALALFIALVSAAYLITNKFVKKSLLSAIEFGILIAISSAILIFVSWTVQADSNLFTNALWFGLSLFTFVVIMGGICRVLGKLWDKILIGGLVLIGILALVVLSSFVLNVIYTIVKQPKFFDTIIDGLEAMGIVFGSFIAVISALGAITLGGAWAVFLAGGGVLLAIEGLAYLAARVLMVIANAMKVLKSVNIDDTAFDNMKKVIINFGELVGLLITAIPSNPLKLAKLPIALKTAKETSIAVSYMGKAVKEFADLKIPTQFDAQGNATAWITIGNAEFATAQENIGKVITCIFKGIMDVVNDPKNKGLFDDNLITDSPAMNAAKVAKMMGSAVSSIAKGIKEFADLRIVTKYNSKGEPIEYQSLTGKDFNKAQQNIGTVITCISDALLSVAKEKPELFEESLFNDSPAMNAAKVAKMMGDAIGSIASGIKQWADLKIVTKYNSKGEPIEYQSLVGKDFDTAAGNIETVLTCIGKALVKTVKNNTEIFADAFMKDSPAMNAAKSMKLMGDVLNETAMAIAAYSSGEFPLYDKDGKILPRDQWMKLDLSKLGPGGDVEQAINTVLTCIGNALKDVVNDPENAEIFDDGFIKKSKATVAATALKDMSVAINNSVDAIIKLSELKTEDLETKINTVKENLRKAIIAMLGIFDVFSNPTVGAKNGVQKEAVKGGLKGFINGVAKVFGGEGKVFETNGSIAEYINNNIDEVENAVDAINNFQKQISTLLSSIGNLVKSYDDNKKHIDSFITTGDSKLDLSSIIAKSINNVKSIYKSVIGSSQGLSIDDELNNTNKLNELISVYIKTLNELVKLSIFAKDTGEDGYNVLRDGILKIYAATQQIEDNEIFKQHVNQLKDYVEAINSIKLDHLGGLKGLVDSMNELSQRLGNLDNLTDAIGNKLSQVLYELVLQLRKAEATIHNAHELQEKRKRLMDESIEKIHNIMDHHMIVEISQQKEEDLTSNPAGTIGGKQIDDGAPQGNDTTPPTSTESKANPEETTAAQGTGNSRVSNQPDAAQLKDVLTFGKFKDYMEKQYLNKIRNSG